MLHIRTDVLCTPGAAQQAEGVPRPPHLPLQPKRTVSSSPHGVQDGTSQDGHLCILCGCKRSGDVLRAQERSVVPLCLEQSVFMSCASRGGAPEQHLHSQRLQVKTRASHITSCRKPHINVLRDVGAPSPSRASRHAVALKSSLLTSMTVPSLVRKGSLLGTPGIAGACSPSEARRIRAYTPGRVHSGHGRLCSTQALWHELARPAVPLRYQASSKSVSMRSETRFDTASSTTSKVQAS